MLLLVFPLSYGSITACAEPLNDNIYILDESSETTDNKIAVTPSKAYDTVQFTLLVT